MRINKTIFFVFFLSINVQSASFDCAKATTKHEKSICFDAELSELDSQMAAAYKKALIDDPDGAKELKIKQRQWLNKIQNSDSGDSYVSTIEELKNAYKLKIIELKGALENINSIEADEYLVEIIADEEVKCTDEEDFSSEGHVDVGQDVVGAYTFFYDDFLMVRIGYDYAVEGESGMAIQKLAESNILIKLDAIICPKLKDDSGKLYLQGGSRLKIKKIQDQKSKAGTRK